MVKPHDDESIVAKVQRDIAEVEAWRRREAERELREALAYEDPYDHTDDAERDDEW